MRRLLLLLLLAAITATAQNNPAPSNNSDADKTAIRDLLVRQVDAWNAHNLDGFMAGYWRSPDLTFYSGGTITQGWQETMTRYRNKYVAAGREMGKLDFYDIYIDLLGPDAAYVRGHWRLQMKTADEASGLFTLIVRKFPDGWKIIHDHTSTP